ncbi:cyanophycinase [Chryseobacterium caseinilyticum]|uniref:Cyanophycinase n=1 Tax=Chryseobacterium caseinilyticum TaxID=2771428 RepID=A0ABR8ZC28_9FLAO|nr:cyanophycinase [Chryseobacterium caseinilyticum]MBD8082847.1 cyanophycinase [Chryseobacterium caseinilyticum]
MNIPKGKLLIIGGNEDRSDSDNEMEKINQNFVSHEILKLLINHENDRIEVITTASSEPESMRQTYTETFNQIGFTNFDFLHFDEEQLHSDFYIERIKAAKTIFITGGDQNKICNKLNETEISGILHEKYKNEEGFLIAGTSAGAMCMPKIIIGEAVNGEAMLKDDIKMVSGLGLIDSCIVDTHFVHRGRFSRLAHAIILHENHLGIGLGEDTALLIEKGDQAMCIGSGNVVIISGKEILQTNTNTAVKGKPIYAENLKVHMLTDGCCIHLTNGAVKPPL